MYFIEKTSRFDFDQTVEKLNGAITDAGWRIPATHDLQATLQKNGYEVLPLKVIELCNPRIASLLLSHDEYRIYSNMMPCRISVYTKTDNKTYISILNAGAMAQQLGGEVEKAMKEAFDASMQFIEQVC